MHRSVPPQLCLIGPHGAGKTTLATRLADHLGVEFRDEIGRHLREEALAADPEQHVLRFDEAFDRAVVEGEIGRDAARGHRAGFVVETWHPGNLAYARIRSPRVAADLEAAAREAARRCGSLMVVPVIAPREVLLARCNEPGGTLEDRTDFFLRVATEATRTARRWGLHLLPAVDTSEATIEACVESILGALGMATRTAARQTRSAA